MKKTGALLRGLTTCAWLAFASACTSWYGSGGIFGCSQRSFTGVHATADVLGNIHVIAPIDACQGGGCGASDEAYYARFGGEHIERSTVEIFDEPVEHSLFADGQGVPYILSTAGSWQKRIGDDWSIVETAAGVAACPGSSSSMGTRVAGWTDSDWLGAHVLSTGCLFDLEAGVVTRVREIGDPPGQLAGWEVAPPYRVAAWIWNDEQTCERSCRPICDEASCSWSCDEVCLGFPTPHYIWFAHTAGEQPVIVGLPRPIPPTPVLDLAFPGGEVRLTVAGPEDNLLAMAIAPRLEAGLLLAYHAYEEPQLDLFIFEEDFTWRSIAVDSECGHPQVRLFAGQEGDEEAAHLILACGDDVIHRVVALTSGEQRREGFGL